MHHLTLLLPVDRDGRLGSTTCTVKVSAAWQRCLMGAFELSIERLAAQNNACAEAAAQQRHGGEQGP